MDNGGQILSTMTLKEYLRVLHKAILYADCAGERAYIPSLHYNRLVNLHEFVENIAMLSAKIQPKTFEKGKSEQMEIVVDSENVNHIKSSAILQYVGEMKNLNMEKKFKFLEAIEHNFRRIMERRNRLLLNSNAQDYAHLLAPSVDILEQMTEQHESLHVIHGDPGFGKTIHLQQLAERFVQRQRETEEPTLPIYVKAKHLARAIEIHGSSLRAISQDWDEGLIPMDEIWEFSTYASQKELHNILTYASSNTHFPGNNQFISGFLSLLGKYNGRLALFVDAFDETDEYDMPHLVHFLSRMTGEENNSVVLTNRNSHSLSFGNLWEKMPDRESKNDKISKYHIDFTPDELRYDMPEKLMAAWEINGMIVEMRMEERYEAFNKVLTHPLFVGFFALMMKENQMMDELGDDEFGLSIKEYTPSHVVFLNNVVDLGIKKAISDRNVGITPERMREIYEAIAYGYFVSNGKEDNLNTLIHYLQKARILSLSKTEIEAIKNGVGPLYSSDGKRLQWTHKGMWEIGASRYVFDIPDLVPAAPHPELFLLSYLQQHTEMTQAETLLDGLWSIIDNDTKHGELLVAAFWKEFFPRIPMFSSLNVLGSSSMEVEIMSDLDEDDTWYAEIIARRLLRGDTRFIHPICFHRCVNDFMPFSHLFDMRIFTFVRIYGHIPGSGYYAARNYFSSLTPKHHSMEAILPHLSDDNIDLFIHTMVVLRKKSILNPLNIRQVSTKDSVSVFQLLMEKWGELHSTVISKFSDVLNEIATDLLNEPFFQMGRAKLLRDSDYDIATLMHALLSYRKSGMHRLDVDNFSTNSLLNSPAIAALLGLGSRTGDGPW